MYIGFVIYVSVFALIMLLIFSKTFRKVVAGAIIFAVLLGVVVLPLHGAMAEELPELFVIEQFKEVECEHGCLKLTFDFHGTLLSFYWEGPLNLTQPVWVTIWNNIEVIDAGYVELPSGSLLFYFLRRLGQTSILTGYIPDMEVSTCLLSSTRKALLLQQQSPKRNLPRRCSKRPSRSKPLTT